MQVRFSGIFKANIKTLSGETMPEDHRGALTNKLRMGGLEGQYSNVASLSRPDGTYFLVDDGSGDHASQYKTLKAENEPMRNCWDPNAGDEFDAENIRRSQALESGTQELLTSAPTQRLNVVYEHDASQFDFTRPLSEFVIHQLEVKA